MGTNDSTGDSYSYGYEYDVNLYLPVDMSDLMKSQDSFFCREYMYEIVIPVDIYLFTSLGL